MNNIKPLVSVVIPLYNKETVIRKTIDSVLNQTYHNFELIVVDDGSSDHSAEVVRDYEDSRITLYMKDNGGPSSARNFGTKKSKGIWIIFLDADDTLLPNALEQLVDPIIGKKKGIDIVCGNFNIIRCDESKKHHLSNYRGYVPFKHKMRWFFLGNVFPRTGAAIISKELLAKNPFPEDLRRFEDLCIMIEWVKQGNIYLIPDIILNYSRDTEDASKPAKDYKNDFIFHMNFSNASFWEKCLLGNLYGSGLKIYPEQAELLKKMYSKWDFYRCFGQVILIANLLYRRYIIRE